jgi:High potential iron-sulfur protein
MTKTPQIPSAGLSRRYILRTAACAAGTIPILGVVLAPSAPSQAMAAKASQASVKYQTTPKANQDCTGCRSFEPPNACKTVAGEIDPKGWCTVWIKK